MTVWIPEYVAKWRPSRGWASTVGPAVEIIERDPASPEALKAWCEIAMVLGDTRAAPLALIVCLHAEATAPACSSFVRLHSHRNLCLLDLGLAQADRPGHLPLRELHTVVPEVPEEVNAWLVEQLAPYDNDLSRAAQLILALVVERVGLASG